MTPYQPRPVVFHGIETHAGWRIKRYAIHLPGGTFEAERFTPALSLAHDALPSPDIAAGRPGAAVLIEHQGAGVDYLVLGWWDRENEIPLLVWVNDGDGWRTARRGESVCVWDLAVLWSEREAWVRHGMRSGGADLDSWAAAAAPDRA